MKNIKITDVRSLPGDSAFLIDDGETSILYDSGFAFTGYDVAENIKRVLCPRTLDYIFLTHSHYDHALGSVYARRYFPEATVIAGEYAVNIFKKPSAKAVMRDLDRKFAARCGVTDYPDLIDELTVDVSVSDNDTVFAGDMEFIVLNLPGHTKCSIGFYLKKQKLLLCCETIGVFDGESTIVPSYLVGYQMTLDSIRRVKSLDIKQMVLPHLGLISPEQTAFYLNNAEESAINTHDEILNILSSGGSVKDAVEFFKNKFYHGYIKSIYPEDAIELNTEIMVKLIQKELEK